MKKTILGIVTASVLFTSCGEAGSIFSGEPEISTAEGIEALKADFIENFGGDQEVFEFDLRTDDHLSGAFFMASASFLRDGVSYSRDYMAHPTEGRVLEESEENTSQAWVKKQQGKVKLSELDFGQIVVKFNEACKLIPSEYEDFTLHYWSFEINNANEVTAEFTIEGTKVGEGNHMEGRNVVTNYYEFDFNMNVDGELEVDE